VPTDYVTTGFVFSSAPTLANLDGDARGQMEIVAAWEDGQLMAWKNSGGDSFVSGWGVDAVLGDADQRSRSGSASLPRRGGRQPGRPERSDRRQRHGPDFHLQRRRFAAERVLHGYGAAAGRVAGRAAESAIAVADLDPASPGLELVVPSDYAGKVYAFRANGTRVPGWETPKVTGGSVTRAAVTLADLDANGTLEALFGDVKRPDVRLAQQRVPYPGSWPYTETGRSRARRRSATSQEMRSWRSWPPRERDRVCLGTMPDSASPAGPRARGNPPSCPRAR